MQAFEVAEIQEWLGHWIREDQSRALVERRLDYILSSGRAFCNSAAPLLFRGIDLPPPAGDRVEVAPLPRRKFESWTSDAYYARYFASRGRNGIVLVARPEELDVVLDTDSFQNAHPHGWHQRGEVLVRAQAGRHLFYRADATGDEIDAILAAAGPPMSPRR